MAERDQVGGALGGHDPGEARDAENVALGGGAAGDEREGRRRHGDPAARHRAAGGRGLVRDVDHLRGAAGVEMGERRPSLRLRRPGAAQELAGRRLDVRLAHQRLADQEAAHAVVGDLGEVLAGGEAGLRDDGPVDRNAARQPPGGQDVGGEGVEVAVVDPDERRLQELARARGPRTCAPRGARPCPRPWRRSRAPAAWASETLARMMRMQSAPRARDSATCQGS